MKNRQDRIWYLRLVNLMIVLGRFNVWSMTRRTDKIVFGTRKFNDRFGSFQCLE